MSGGRRDAASAAPAAVAPAPAAAPGAGARRHDVAIVGAGLPGLALAVALADAGLDVALCDRAPIAGGDARDAAAAQASFDTRIYAVSPGSAALLARLDAWAALPPERLVAVEGMRIEGDAGGVLAFSAYDLGTRALAWIVEERALRAALVAAAHARGVTLVAPVAFTALDFGVGAATLHDAEGSHLAARLVVGADGLGSWARAAAGIRAEPLRYPQTAVVANFDCEHEHRGRALQWFRDDGGVLAFLPLPGRCMSMVWSAPDALAQTLAADDAPTLAARVAEAGHHALGELRLRPGEGPRSFPLSFLRPPSVVAHRFALVGDAAHGVHPLAGQGVNLGFGDVAALADVLAARGPVDDAGAPILLERYARRRAEPVLAMQTVTDVLARVFGIDRRWLRSLRNGGMATIDRYPPLKRALAQPALR